MLSSNNFSLRLIPAAFALAMGSAHAAFDNPATASWGGWMRGDTGTVYQHWNVFADENGSVDPTILDTTPDVGSFGAAPHSVKENAGVAFVTGGGNIYSFSAVTDLTVDIAGTAVAGQPTRVALQLNTLGTELAYDSVTLNNIAFDSRTELSRISLGGFGGAGVETLFLWTLPSGLASYVFDFNAAESSLSLDQLAVDVGAVPLPAAVWLLGSAFVGLASTARRGGHLARA